MELPLHHQSHYRSDRRSQLYRELLLDDIVPFWIKHGIDWEHSAVLSCIADDGSILSSNGQRAIACNDLRHLWHLWLGGQCRICNFQIS